MTQTHSFRVGRPGLLAAALVCALGAGSALAVDPKQNTDYLQAREFFKPELYISSSHVGLADALGQLPNKAAWESFLQTRDAAGQVRAHVYLDPRSGAVVNLMAPFPLIPGNGVGNEVSLQDLGQQLGRQVSQVDERVVADATLRFVQGHAALLGIDTRQLGAVKAVQVTPELWQVSIPQQFKGVPVRDGRLAATISHGNLVVIGTETWGDVKATSGAVLSADKALDAGFAFAAGRSAIDVLEAQPELQWAPYAPQEYQAGEGFVGPLGKGYGHVLVWRFVFNRPPYDNRWEVLVDAQTGEVLAFQDLNQHVAKQATGGVYPLTNSGQCSTGPGQCGTMQSGWPMPWANTGLAAPNNFTNGAGVFDYTSGTATTSLSGRYIRISDNCGAISLASGTGDLALGGTNNQHDCTTPGIGGAGNTPASRSAFYELNRIAEQARGWLPTNTWLQAQMTANVNINLTCNAFWNGSTVNFYRSGGGCGNTGEMAGVFDHEWGHGMDDNDAAGALSNSSEAYADIAAIFRLNTSCIGQGFSVGAAGTCGASADGTPNRNEAQTGAAYCTTNCSGVRDADYAAHSPATPATALGFVCGQCSASSGPCGRQVHCAAAPSRQAAWDLVARDLRGAPYNMNAETALLVGTKLFYNGSGNIGLWHACTCGSSSDGCGATNAYTQWLAADDDNGNVNDGTPHKAALFAAFNRHGIACATPSAGDSGCAAGPTGAATLTVTPGNNQNALSWTAVSGASRYWVMKTEGHAGCQFGKTRIADITGTTYTDTEAANGRTYSYNIVAQGATAACYGPTSACVQGTPTPGTPTPDFSVACAPSSLSVPQTGSTTSTCTVTSTGGFASAVNLACTGLPAGASCAFSASPVTPPANGSVNSTLTVTTSGAAAATTAFQVVGTSGATSRSASLSLTVTPPGPVTVFFDNFETSLGWTTNPNATDTATTGAWERGDPEATNSSGVKQQGTTVSGVNDLVTARLAGASAGANDVDGGTTSIQSPAIALPATGNLTLSFSYYFAHGTNSSTADFFRVSIVGTSGTTQVFQELGNTTDDDAAFVSQSVSLNAFAGQTVRILIQTADAAGASLVEAAVDDVRVTQQ